MLIHKFVCIMRGMAEFRSFLVVTYHWCSLSENISNAIQSDYLLHWYSFITFCILQIRSGMWGMSKYPMKRLCAMLLPLVRSRRCPYVNLQNQITRFALLKYKSAVNQRIFRCGLEKTPIWPLHWVFNVSGVAEKLYSLYSIYMMNLTQEQRLKEHYATTRGICVNEIGVSF